MKLLRHISLVAAVSIVTSCFSSGKLQPENVVNTQTPMVFGTSSAASESVETKGSSVLDQGFKVHTWKHFGTAAQQTVMDGFKVEYRPAASVKWEYVGVNNQIQRYWDLGGFSYEFRAVSPYSEDVTITDGGLTISKPFFAQVLTNGVYNKAGADSEPFVVAQVSRADLGSGVTDRYEDRDLLKNQEINTYGKLNATRGVHLPFHHLMSKLGFKVFVDDPQPTALNYTITLQSVEVYAVKNGLKTQGTYAATNAQGLGNGTFTDPSPVSGETLLFKNDQGYTGDFRQYLNADTAFDLTPDGLQQIPQNAVKLHVKMKMQTLHQDNSVVDFSFDRYLSLDKTKTDGDLFDWAPDTRYIYYLRVPNLHEHEMVLGLCETSPWEEVQTSDIPVTVE